MLDTFKTLIANQFEAAFCTLNRCIERCPETAWNGRVVNLAFCQVVFHPIILWVSLYNLPTIERFCMAHRQSPRMAHRIC
jgi:hypothetical protein